MKQAIISGSAPSAIGPYSQAIAAGNMVFVSGQLPIDPATGSFPSDDIKDQTRMSLENIEAILKSAGLTMANVVKTTVLLDDIGDFGAMNEVYGSYFAEPYPARAAFEVAKLPKGAKVEIEVIAVR
ncbi:MAG: RidA family protein [Faecousia sp.]